MIYYPTKGFDMKKIFLVLAVALIACSSVFALNNAARTNVDFSSSMYLNTGEFGLLSLNIVEGNSSFSFSLNGDLAAIGKEGFGGYAHIGFVLPGHFDLYVAGAYKLKLNNKVNLLLTVGPTFVFGRNYFTFGTDVLAHFDYNVIKNWFLRFSLGLDMDFFKNNKNGDKSRGFSMTMQLPMVAIGYSF